MNQNLAYSLDRADELLRELLAEYEAALSQQTVSVRAQGHTHEICGHLRGILDRLAYRYWEQHISPSLPLADRSGATVYFPVAQDQQSFDSTLGRWRWKAVKAQHQSVYDYMLKQQPFTDAANRWLGVLADVANKGKHVDLLPQTRVEDRRSVVTGASGSVSWGPGVTFGSGVRIMGAPINPATQQIVPTAGVTQRHLVWVGFRIAGHDVDAAVLCKQGCAQVRRIAADMTRQFGLS